MAFKTIVSTLCRPPTLSTRQPGASIDGIGMCLGPDGVGAALVANNTAISAVFSPHVADFDA